MKRFMLSLAMLPFSLPALADTTLASVMQRHQSIQLVVDTLAATRGLNCATTKSAQIKPNLADVNDTANWRFVTFCFDSRPAFSSYIETGRPVSASAVLDITVNKSNGDVIEVSIK